MSCPMAGAVAGRIPHYAAGAQASVVGGGADGLNAMK